MTIELRTTEESAAANAQIAKLEAAAQSARSALKEFETTQASIPPQYRRDIDGKGTQLESEVITTQKALVAAQNDAHNANLYTELLAGIEKNMAANATEKAAQAAQQAGANEEQFKAQALHAYLNAGGTSLGFAGEWPSLRAELVRQKTISALTQAQPTSLVDAYIARRNAPGK